MPAADATPPHWTLRLLGGFELRRGTTLYRRLPSRPTLLLLVRLALQPDRDHPREELIDLLWPQATLEVGRNRLRQALSVLRSVLEDGSADGAAPVVQTIGRQALRLAPDAVRCDVQQLRAAAAAGRAAEVTQLARGELLPGVFDDWVLEERRALDTLVERSRAAAAPKPPPARPGTPRSGAPVYLTRWLGEPALLQAATERVLAHRLVLLRGPGGGGKTRLAAEVLRRLEQHEPPAFDRLAFAALANCHSLQDLHEALARTFGMAPGPDALTMLRDNLNGTHCLLVLNRDPRPRHA